MNPLRVLSFLTLLLPVIAVGQTLYLGTYTKTGGSHGVYQYKLDTATGALAAPVLAAETENPSFLALHPNGRVLYAVGEKGPGSVSAFGIAPASGGLSLLNSQSIAAGKSAGPCHLAVDATGRTLIVANYGGGSVAAFPLFSDGRIGARSALQLHAGPRGPRAGSQNAPHAHGITFSPDQRTIYVPDLGLDRVLAYRVNSADAQLTAATPAFTVLPPGSGPRHGEFSPDGKFFYVADELDSTVTVLARDVETGGLTLRETVSTLPSDFHGVSWVAEIHVHPNGRTVYVSNRGHDSLAVFARDAVAGTLTLVELVPCGGKYPRSFALSPDGSWLVCAHRNSDSLAVFAIDPAGGKLTRVGPLVSLPSPVCVLFAPAPHGAEN